ncbi:MAG TPA: hypothetical protein PLM81_12500 [Ginsengibacter sp.]|nr:hypothetical protein [Ginsengibacter sp.]HRP45627.1 hypothetical protein [Ginsengibacter sp.]
MKMISMVAAREKYLLLIQTVMGLYYVVTRRGIKRASADVGLMCTALNLRRIMNLADKKLLQKFLQELWLSFFALKDYLGSHFRLHCSINSFPFRIGSEKSATIYGLV